MRALSAKHWLIMLACCLVPLGLLAAVFVLRVDLGSFGFFGLMLLCPLLHLFMMRGMGHGGHAAHHQVGIGSATVAAAEEGKKQEGVKPWLQG